MRFIFILMAVLGAFVPESAMASGLGVINPVGGNAWDLYVYGNGRIIFYVLNSIKMLMVPDVGNTMFNTLLLLMGSIGFLALAVGAGFDPGKNLIRMFTYIVVVWGVSYGSTKVVVNVTIIDKFGPPSTQPGVVSGVPALVALPAVLISQVGEYFTNVMETYFSLPDASDAFKTGSKSGVPGQFNLFAKMMSESDEYIITSPELKKSLSAYMTDCVIPAIAMNRFAGPGKDGQVTGANALLRTTNMVATLQSAQHNSIMTKYYPMTDGDNSWMASVPSAIIADLGTPAQGATSALSFGVVLTCTDAYSILKSNLEANARLLLDAGNAAWAKAGVLTPFESVVQSMLAQTAAPGSAASGYSSPAGYILQQTMLNSTSGAFRNSAILSGNNELMQAAALSQAEQSQKSAWAAGFAVFNNMMGYVYTVLQAFIFAITPIMVIALMVPGLGKKIFTNYIEILIWLSLWMPMLALINYIITLFGTDSLQTVVGMEGGLSANNKVLMSEKTKDLILAAQFLGTMVPLLTWGLVKGALAFTEFISHGVGSSFASQAGASAATGNMSLNNMSMNNTSMNKYDTSMSSAVGTQGVTAHTSAGSMLVKGDVGGASMTAAGGGVDLKKSAQETLSHTRQQGQTMSELLNEAKSNGWSVGETIAHSKGKDIGSQGALQLADMAQKQEAFSLSNAREDSKAATTQDSLVENAGSHQKAGLGAHVGLNASMGTPAGGLLGSKVSVDTGVKRSADKNVDENIVGAKTNAATTTISEKQNAPSISTQASGNRSVSSTNSQTVGAKDSKSAEERQAAQRQAVIGEAISKQTSFNDSISKMQSVTSAMGVSSDVDIKALQNIQSSIASLESSLFSDKDYKSGESRLSDTLSNNVSSTKGTANSLRRTEAAMSSGINPMAHSPHPSTLNSEIETHKEAVVSRMDELGNQVHHNSAEISRQSKVVRDNVDLTTPVVDLVSTPVNTVQDMKDKIAGKDTPGATSPAGRAGNLGGLAKRHSKSR
jgi:hypothetical protein